MKLKIAALIMMCACQPLYASWAISCAAAARITAVAELENGAYEFTILPYEHKPSCGRNDSGGCRIPGGAKFASRERLAIGESVWVRHIELSNKCVMLDDSGKNHGSRECRHELTRMISKEEYQACR